MEDKEKYFDDLNELKRIAILVREFSSKIKIEPKNLEDLLKNVIHKIEVENETENFQNDSTNLILAEIQKTIDIKEKETNKIKQLRRKYEIQKAELQEILKETKNFGLKLSEMESELSKVTIENQNLRKRIEEKKNKIKEIDYEANILVGQLKNHSKEEEKAEAHLYSVKQIQTQRKNKSHYGFIQIFLFAMTLLGILLAIYYLIIK